MAPAGFSAHALVKDHRIEGAAGHVYMPTVVDETVRHFLRALHRRWAELLDDSEPVHTVVDEALKSFGRRTGVEPEKLR